MTVLRVAIAHPEEVFQDMHSLVNRSVASVCWEGVIEENM